MNTYLSDIHINERMYLSIWPSSPSITQSDCFPVLLNVRFHMKRISNDGLERVKVAFCRTT